MLTIDVSRTIMLIGLSEPLCFLAYYLAQQQVGQAACAQTEELVGEPFLAEYFFHDGVIDHGIHYRVDATGRLQADYDASLVLVFLYGLAHHVDAFWSGSCPLFSR